MYKIETTSKVSRKFPSRINVGRRDAAPSTRLWTQPTSPPLHSPERAIHRPKRTHIPHRNHQQPPSTAKRPKHKARAPSPRPRTQPASAPQLPQEPLTLPPSPTHDRKSGYKWQSQTMPDMSKIETTRKVSLKSPNSEAETRAHAEPSTLDTAHKSPPQPGKS